MLRRIWGRLTRRRNRGKTPIYPQWTMQPGCWQIPTNHMSGSAIDINTDWPGI